MLKHIWRWLVDGQEENNMGGMIGFILGLFIENAFGFVMASVFKTGGNADK